MQNTNAERRSAPRHSIYLWTVSRRHGSPIREKVIITELSRTGFKIRTPVNYSEGDAMFLEFPQSLLAEARIIRKHERLPEFGCRFAVPIANALLERVIARANQGLSVSGDGVRGGETPSAAPRGSSEGP